MIRLRSGCSDYNLATLQSVVLKFRTDVLSVLELVKLLEIIYCIQAVHLPATGSNLIDTFLRTVASEKEIVLNESKHTLQIFDPISFIGFPEFIITVNINFLCRVTTHNGDFEPGVM